MVYLDTRKEKRQRKFIIKITAIFHASFEAMILFMPIDFLAHVSTPSRGVGIIRLICRFSDKLFESHPFFRGSYVKVPFSPQTQKIEINVVALEYPLY